MGSIPNSIVKRSELVSEFIKIIKHIILILIMVGQLQTCKKFNNVHRNNIFREQEYLSYLP